MDVVREKTVKKILPYVKLIEKEALKGPISLHILVTDYCVNRCNMCGHWKTKNRNNLDISILKEIWDDCNENEVESICLTGGDPILHPDFDKILDMKRNFDLGIICTGNFKKNFDFSKLASLRWIRFSIDSLDPARYTFIRGLDNLYGTILPNVRKAQEHQKEVGINFTIQKSNCMDIRDIIKFSAENNIYRLMIYPMHGDGNLCIGRDEIEIILEQLNDMISKNYHKRIPENNLQFLYDSLIQAYSQDEDVRKVTFGNYPCIINKIHLAIGSDGNVFPCEMIADDTDEYGERTFWELQKFSDCLMERQTSFTGLGNVNSESIIKIWKRNFNKTFCSGKCDNCFSRYQPINQAYYENRNKKVFI